MFKPSSDILLTIPQGSSFVELSCKYNLIFVFFMLSSLFLVALWSPARKRLTSWLYCMLCFHMLMSLSQSNFPNDPLEN